MDSYVPHPCYYLNTIWGDSIRPRQSPDRTSDGTHHHCLPTNNANRNPLVSLRLSLLFPIRPHAATDNSFHPNVQIC